MCSKISITLIIRTRAFLGIYFLHYHYQYFRSPPPPLHISHRYIVYLLQCLREKIFGIIIEHFNFTYSVPSAKYLIPMLLILVLYFQFQKWLKCWYCYTVYPSFANCGRDFSNEVVYWTQRSASNECSNSSEVCIIAMTLKTQNRWITTNDIFYRYHSQQNWTMKNIIYTKIDKWNILFALKWIIHFRAGGGDKKILHRVTG